MNNESGVEPEVDRPRWHFTTASTWINDPNGLIWLDGTWHLFFQNNPESTTWGNMSWGHATSPDLIHWTELPIALRCTPTTEFFSGSCVLDAAHASGLGTPAEPALIAAYTANHPPGSPHARHQWQELAFSRDGGATWTANLDQPIVDRGSPDFRDPKLVPFEDGWIMVAVEAEDRQVVFYRSENLRDWTYLSSFGPAHAAGGVWECPDLLRVGVEGTDDHRWVLLLSVNPGGVAGGAGCQYFVGDFDGTRFVADRDAGVSTDPTARATPDLRAYDWLDFGRDCYAVVSFANVPDGRCVVLGWMNNWDYALATPLAGGRGAMTIPRELTLVRDAHGRHRLRQRPVRELPAEAIRQVRLADGETLEVNGLTIGYAAGRLCVDRPADPVRMPHELFESHDWALIAGQPDAVDLDLVVDTCSVEIFADGGLVTMTELTFTGAASSAQ